MSTQRGPGISGILATQLYWEDLPVGFRYRTAARTITEADVVAFAGLTGDYNRLHVDADYAAGAAFGQRIAHGLLVATVGVGLNTRSLVNQLVEKSLLGLLETRFQFLRPTFFGDTIAVDVEVAEQRETSKPDRGIIVLRRIVLNQRQETLIDGAATMLVRRRPVGEPVDASLQIEGHER